MSNSRVPTSVAVLTCTLFTISVVCGAVFFTYLLTKVDLLEQEVIKFSFTSLFSVSQYHRCHRARDATLFAHAR